MEIVERLIFGIFYLLFIKRVCCGIHIIEDQPVVLQRSDSLDNSSIKAFFCLPESITNTANRKLSVLRFSSNQDFIFYYSLSVTKVIGTLSCEKVYKTPQPRQSRLRFRDLMQEKLVKVSASSFPPYSFKVTPTKFDGIHFRILKAAARQFNFTFSISVPSWKSTGIQLQNGTWTGMMGDILYRNYDIALVMTPTASRFGFVDFTCPAGVAHLVFFSAMPEIDINQWAILAPYTRMVWFLMLVTFLGMVRVFLEISQIFHMKKIGVTESYLIITSLSLEHSITTPKMLRLLTTLWMAYTLTITTGYKSNLASYLSTPGTLEEKPKTFADLHAAKDYKVFLDLVGISGYEYLNKSSQSPIISLKKRSILTSDSSVCILNAVSHKNSVCVGWDIALSLTVAKNVSSIYGKHEKIMYKSHDSLYYTYGSLAMPKNSNFTEFFDFITTSSFETGLVPKWHREVIQYFETIGARWASSLEQHKLNLLSKRHRNKTLTIKHFQFLFCIATLGLVLAILQFTYEILTYD